MVASKFKVCSHRCDQCLFSPNKIVSNARKREIIKECLLSGAYFICHKATIAGEETCLIRIAERLGAIEEVE